MSAPTKLRPGNSEVTKLKLLWRDLSDDARAFWQELFVSQTSQAEIRRQLLAKLKVNLRFDKQLNSFRDWELEQRTLDLEAERQEEDERRALAEHPNWTLDEAREAVLKKAYKRAEATGNFDLGLAVAKVDQVERTGKFRAELEKAKLQIAREAEDRMKEALEFEREKVRLADAKLRATQEQVAKLRDVKAPMTDEDRRAIVAKIDEIMGIKPLTP